MSNLSTVSKSNTSAPMLSSIIFDDNPSNLNRSLQSFRQVKKQKLGLVGIPTRKTESWKYSAKRLKLADQYPTLSTQTSRYETAYELDCHQILISNGRVTLNDADIPGVSVKQFSDLNEAEANQVLSGVIAESDKFHFADVNAAHFDNGIFLTVADNTQVDKPVKVIFEHLGHGMSFPRIFVFVGKNASFELIEELNITADETSEAFINSVSDITVSENAQLHYIRMNIDQGTCKHIGATGVKLLRNARFNSYCMALGSELARHDLHVKMLEPGAECDLNGVCVTRDRQHYDNHTCIEHIAPNCTSNETYRCIADQQSSIVFNGRIHIHPDAQKSLGSMSNKNLLLSSHAEINAKPELEIYADDVKCAHGTTMGQLNETEVYYLKTRGISAEQAKLILTLGFVLEVVRSVPIESIADFWEQQLTDILGFQIS
ncbi:MAG: Fe-S cluster assembly protein SufD [Oleiphilaceae bacterium]|jgi:Fe-S cluster assembly protein SufD